jgi:glucose-6-phosphate isomerase
VNNFFATFIEVLRDHDAKGMEVEPGITSGDYLHAFLHGTRDALYDSGRESVTITTEKLDARSIGVLIALYERAVGFYASLVNINAYHQPGVEAGKKMAGTLIALQRDVLACLRNDSGKPFTADEVAKAINAEENTESVFKILEHMSANGDHQITKIPAKNAIESKYASASS